MPPVSKNLMYKYNFKCLTEGRNYEIWDLSTSLPNTCPINDSHVIDSNNVEILCKAYDTYLDLGETRTVEQTEENATQELFRVQNYNFQCPSNSLTKYLISFNYPVVVLAVKLITKEYNDLDILNNYALINSPIGAVTVPLKVGCSNVYISKGATDYLNRGVEVIITDGVNTDELGECTKVYSNRIVTTKKTVNSYALSNSAYIKIKPHNIIDFILHKEVPLMVLGDSKIGGSIIKPGISLSIEYQNLSLDVNKDFSFCLEYMY